MAQSRMGNGAAAVHLLKMMNPVERTRRPEDVARYRGEPYVVAADVYSAPGKAGRSGWTWYTGSAGWMYRIWIEEVLGFQLRGDTLTLNPVIPDDWPGFEMTYRHRSSTYEIKVLWHAENDPMTLELDGRKVNDGVIHLDDDGGTHQMTMRMARRSAAPVKQPPRKADVTSNGAWPARALAPLPPVTAQKSPSESEP
jgi:cyclic beta-1,2-glucan synthetase